MMADKTTRTPKLLSGGNPQIPKGFGDGPVQDYIAAVPGWKQGVCAALDKIIARAVPDVKKAVKWNTPMYGVREGEWFTSFHCFTRYVKVTFFAGASLKPPPPETSKYEAIRYFHIHETDTLDDAQLARWMKQASALPGEKM